MKYKFKNPSKKRKEILIEAFQFTDVEKDVVYSTVKDIQANIYHDWDVDGSPLLKIPYPGGEKKCCIGDYLIHIPGTEYGKKISLFKKNVFEEIFEPVDEKNHNF